MSGFKLKPSAGGGTEKAPPGNHLAVLVAIIDMGTQEHFYQQRTSWRHDVYLCWELVGEKIAGANKNHVIGAAVTFSLHEKATLRAWVQGRTGKALPPADEFDLTSELGQPCMLNVVLGDTGWPRVDGVAAIPKGIPCPAPGNKPVAITLDQFKAGATIPDWLPWHMGNVLDEHVRACREIGGPKPVRKSAEPKAEPVATGPVPF